MLAHGALSHSFEGHDEGAARMFGIQMLVVRLAQGGLDELVQTVESSAKQYPQLPVWRCILASIYAQLGHRAPGRQELEALASDDFCDVPPGDGWLASLSLLAEVVVYLGDVPARNCSTRCCSLRRPPRGRARAPVSGLRFASPLLASTMSRYEDAERHFEHALKMNTQIRSPPWIACTQRDYARMLLLRNDPGDRHNALSC